MQRSARSLIRIHMIHSIREKGGEEIRKIGSQVNEEQQTREGKEDVLPRAKKGKEVDGSLLEEVRVDARVYLRC